MFFVVKNSLLTHTKRVKLFNTVLRKRGLAMIKERELMQQVIANQANFTEIEHYMKQVSNTNSIVSLYLQANIEYAHQNYNKALKFYNEIIKRRPYSYDVHNKLFDIYLIKKEYIQAMESLVNATLVQAGTPLHKPNEFRTKMDQIIKMAEANRNLGRELINDLTMMAKKCVSKINSHNLKDFPYSGINPPSNYIGNFIDIGRKQYYVGIYDKGMYNLLPKGFESKSIAAEILEVATVNDQYNLYTQDKKIIPIAAIKSDNEIIITDKHGPKIYKQNALNRYYYYTVEGNVSITANENIVIGKPLYTTKVTKKEVVITLCIDALSQQFIDEEGLENVMPNTYHYFKEGTICNNVYSSGEWTLPAIASLCTAQPTSKHHLFHPTRRDSILENEQTIFEMFKTAGYVTGIINGDWRMSPLYGYLRGVDRFVYQNAGYGFPDAQVVAEAIEHLDSFKGNSQYLWVSLSDLHYVSDGDKPGVFVQTNIQDKSKREEYKWRLINLDRTLENLYHYINTNYDQSKCLVTLVSDYGASYLNRLENDKLSNTRIKVPIMVKSSECIALETNELMQTTDYLSIMTRLAQTGADLVKKDTRLPMCFIGESSKRREYTYSESIYPDRPYVAAINTMARTIFFTTKGKVTHEGTIPMDKYSIEVWDKYSNTFVHSKELVDWAYNIVLEHTKDNIDYTGQI